MNAYTRSHMIAELKKLGYERIKVKGGVSPLETAPDGNLYYAYLRITGRQRTVEQQKKINQLKGVGNGQAS